MYEDIAAFPFEDKDIPVSIQSMGISYCDGTYRISREKSNVFVLEYIMKGKGTLINGNGTFTPGQGDVYLLKQGEKHIYFSDANDPWEKIWVNVKGGLIASLVEVYGLREVTYIPHVNCLDLFEKLYRICRQGIGYEAVNEQSAIIIHEILSRFSHALHSAKDVNNEAAMIKAIIENSLESKISLTEIAAQAHLSKSQTIRIFKQAFHKTPYDYLMERRIEMAKILLLNSQLTSKEIAYRLQFADEHYFSGYFKKKVLLSPQAYKRMYQVNMRE